MSIFTETTEGIRVTVHPEFLAEQSDVDNNSFAFAYTISIENGSDMTVQLVNRHWRVISDERQIADVKGPGVVGKQPVLEPEERFEYSSWTVIHHPIGAMVGSFTFVSDDARFFDVAVPRFELLHRESIALH